MKKPLLAILLLLMLLVHWIVVKTDPNVSFVVSYLSLHLDDLEDREAQNVQESSMEFEVSSMAYRTEKLTWIKYSLTVTDQIQKDDSIHLRIVQADFSHKIPWKKDHFTSGDQTPPDAEDFLVNPLSSHYLSPEDLDFPENNFYSKSSSPLGRYLDIRSGHKANLKVPPEELS